MAVSCCQHQRVRSEETAINLGPRVTNGTSTTIEPEWSAAIGRSSAGSAVGTLFLARMSRIVASAAYPSRPADSGLTPSAATCANQACAQPNGTQRRRWQGPRDHGRLLPSTGTDWADRTGRYNRTGWHQVELRRRAELSVPARQEPGGERGAIRYFGQHVQAVEGDRVLAVRAAPTTGHGLRSGIRRRRTKSIPDASGRPPPQLGTGPHQRTRRGRPPRTRQDPPSRPVSRAGSASLPPSWRVQR
jgi:hypothetical protein